MQGSNEVRWRPGQEASLAPACSNLWSFESKFTVLKKILVTLLGLFGDPSRDSAPGELRPRFTPHYAPGSMTISVVVQGCGAGGKISDSNLSKISDFGFPRFPKFPTPNSDSLNIKGMKFGCC